MPSDLWSLYALMLKSRLFEEAVAQLWHAGLLSGEMHLGTGEEAVIAGVGVSVHRALEAAQALEMEGISAGVLEAGIRCRYARVCTQTTLPYARHLEDQVLPNKERICAGVRNLIQP